MIDGRAKATMASAKERQKVRKRITQQIATGGRDALERGRP